MNLQYILAEKHSLLNRKSAPCTKYEDLGSSFSECLVQKVMKMTDCKVKQM